ncbi:MAG: pyridoxamine 5'-phosphate oxidase family protein [Lachnospiraceae bacterium]|nr:pyridoxamine 5'-phosphate oxidase family protein [Lachnospiraceae bacterium]
MRRRDREVTSLDKILDMIKKCTVCRIAFLDGDFPYIVPMNFGFESDGEKIVLYFHGAGEGKKLECVRKNPNVAFEMDCETRIAGEGSACSYTMYYESVCGRGRLEEVCGAEKIKGLTSIMRQATGRADWEFEEKAVAAVTVLRLNVETITGKEHTQK